MSAWIHALCDPCWDKRNPGQQPLRIRSGSREELACCSCAQFTISGIYARGNPVDYTCAGLHGPVSDTGEG